MDRYSRLAVSLTYRGYCFGDVAQPEMTYGELVRWSVLHDCQVARLSMTDDRFREFFVIVPGYGEKGYAEKRDEALGMIREAIAYGLDPGEVRCQHQTQPHVG